MYVRRKLGDFCDGMGRDEMRDVRTYGLGRDGSSQESR